MTTRLPCIASRWPTSIAAAIAGPQTGALDSETLGALFAVVAGLLLHTGAAHLLHEAGEAGPVKGGAAVFTGAGVAAAMTLFHAPHVHPEDAHHERPNFAAPSDHTHDHTHRR